MLDAEQAEKVRNLLASSAWRDLMKPTLIERGRQFSRMAIGFGSERPKPYDQASTDFLRGVVHEIEWMLSAWEGDLAAYDTNRLRDEMERGHNGTGANLAQLPTG